MLCSMPLFLGILTNMCNAILCYRRCDVKKDLKLTLSFLSSGFSRRPKSQDKNLEKETDFLAIQKNSLIRKLWLISKFKPSQTRQKTIKTHILFIISRSKGNEAVIFCQLKKFRMRNIFLQNSCRKMGQGGQFQNQKVQFQDIQVYLDLDIQ